MNNLLPSLKRASDTGLRNFLQYASEAYATAVAFADETQQDFWAAVVACIEIEQKRRQTP